jgi:hypothetical protein
MDIVISAFCGRESHGHGASRIREIAMEIRKRSEAAFIPTAETGAPEATAAAANTSADASKRYAFSRGAGTYQGRPTGQHTSASGSMAATPIDRATISCLTNAHYHSCREAFLDTVHRWFMFLVIALGAAALTDAVSKLLQAASGLTVDTVLVKELCAASAAIFAALDLTFDLSNRARTHAMMKRRYFELLADLRENHKTPETVSVCVERFSADEEPVYRVLYMASWNAAQKSVYGEKAMRFEITPFGNMFKNWWRRPAADYPVVGGYD